MSPCLKRVTSCLAVGVIAVLLTPSESLNGEQAQNGSAADEREVPAGSFEDYNLKMSVTSGSINIHKKSDDKIVASVVGGQTGTFRVNPNATVAEMKAVTAAYNRYAAAHNLRPVSEQGATKDAPSGSASSSTVTAATNTPASRSTLGSSAPESEVNFGSDGTAEVKLSTGEVVRFKQKALEVGGYLGTSFNGFGYELKTSVLGQALGGGQYKIVNGQRNAWNTVSHRNSMYVNGATKQHFVAAREAARIADAATDKPSSAPNYTKLVSDLAKKLAVRVDE